VSEEARGDCNDPENIKGWKDSQRTSPVEAFQRNRPELIFLLQKKPGDQETAQDEKAQNAERSGENRKRSHNAHVIQNYQENCDRANPI
jgi:hypothetical protein